MLGTAKYVGDYRVPGMLHARCLRSDLPHARIVRLDVTPALQVPGVLAAITCEDFVDHGRFGFPVQDMYMLAHERVRYVGDAIAAVAAETEEALAAGLAAIDRGAGAAAGRLRPGRGACSRTRRSSASSPGMRRTRPVATCWSTTSCARGDPDAAAVLRRDAGRALQHRAPGARLHRDRGRARRPLARTARASPSTPPARARSSTATTCAGCWAWRRRTCG